MDSNTIHTSYAGKILSLSDWSHYSHTSPPATAPIPIQQLPNSKCSVENIQGSHQKPLNAMQPQAPCSGNSATTTLSGDTCASGIDHHEVNFALNSERWARHHQCAPEAVSPGHTHLCPSCSNKINNWPPQSQ